MAYMRPEGEKRKGTANAGTEKLRREVIKSQEYPNPPVWPIESGRLLFLEIFKFVE